MIYRTVFLYERNGGGGEFKGFSNTEQYGRINRFIESVLFEQNVINIIVLMIIFLIIFIADQ